VNSALPILLVVAGIAFVLIVGLAFFIANSVIHPARSSDSRTPADSGLTHEAFEFRSGDGVRLAGWWLPANSAPESAPVVIFLHGYTQSKAACLDVGALLVEAGYSVLSFDFRGHGASDGSTATLGTLEMPDATAAFEAARSRTSGPVHLLGWSQGGAMAIMLAADQPEVASAISDCGFATLRHFLEASIPAQSHLPFFPIGSLAYLLAGRLAGTDLDRNSALAAVGRVRQPLLLVQGEDDRFTPPSDVDLLAAAATGSSRLEVWKVAGAGHLGAVTIAPLEYRTRVLAFLAGPDPAVPRPPVARRTKRR